MTVLNTNAAVSTASVEGIRPDRFFFLNQYVSEQEEQCENIQHWAEHSNLQ